MFTESLFHRKSFSKITQLSTVILLVSIGAGGLDTIWAIYLVQILHSEALVGVMTALFSAVFIIASCVLMNVMSKHSAKKQMLIAMLTNAALYVLFWKTNNVILFTILFIIHAITLTIRRQSLNIMLRDQSTNKTVSRNSSVVFAIMNIGWLIGPLAAGQIADSIGIRSIFLFAAVFSLLASLELWLSRLKEHHHIHEHVAFWKNLKEYFSVPRLRTSYLLNTGIRAWWVLIYIYIPLYLSHSGISLTWIGYFLFAAIIPLVMIEATISRYVEKHGFRFYFTTGFAILSFCTLGMFIIREPVWVMGLAIAGCAGAALIEPSTQSYFYKVIKIKDEHKYSAPYITSNETGGIISKLFGAAIIAVLPYTFVFLGFALLLAYYTILSIHIPQVK